VERKPSLQRLANRLTKGGQQCLGEPERATEVRTDHDPRLTRGIFPGHREHVTLHVSHPVICGQRVGQGRKQALEFPEDMAAIGDDYPR